MKREYESEIILALKTKPRDGLALQNDLHIRADRTHIILEEMEDNDIIHWDAKKLVWQLN